MEINISKKSLKIVLPNSKNNALFTLKKEQTIKNKLYKQLFSDNKHEKPFT